MKGRDPSLAFSIFGCARTGASIRVFFNATKASSCSCDHTNFLLRLVRSKSGFEIKISKQTSCNIQPYLRRFLIEQHSEGEHIFYTSNLLRICPYSVRIHYMPKKLKTGFHYTALLWFYLQLRWRDLPVSTS
uniref:Secreted protein n=1 Tax=Haemonchus placei TaxID=6290 RepID=A0A0N4VTC3_HAEPC